MSAHGENGDLARLADRMIIRHLRVSVPDPGMREELQRDHTPEPLLERKIRCVAVVGAGASASLLGRGKALASKLEEQFDSERDARRAELFRLQRVYGLDPDDFETRIAALSRTPEVTREVRTAISEWYSYRHPTILGYELLAHLLKHRFIDAIISFNFDELLDQSLDDELGVNGYRRLVSDRDCSNVVEDPDAPEYLPLYIKLHGTAAEPDSLMLTREAYYKLPQRLMSVVEALLKSHIGVVLNVGSAMTGFDLHRLLRIPEQLEIYDLSPKPIEEPVCEEITSERLNPLGDSLHPDEFRDEPHFARLAADLKPRQRKPDCDDWMKRLVQEMRRRSGKGKSVDPGSLASLVFFRSVDRHEAVADVLGPDATLSRWMENPKRWGDDYVEYLRQRTIIELALSGAKARGLAQLSWLALDRCGTYFEAYRQASREAGKASRVERWSSLRLAGGLKENEVLPDVVESDWRLCEPKACPTFDQGSWALREFIPDLLAARVARKLGKDEDRIEKRLSRTLRNLQKNSEVEIHATDDQVCAKAFDDATTLPTLTSLTIFTAGLFQELDPDDEVYISCETGEWLVKDKTMIELLSRQNRIEVITAFDFKSRQLRKRYGDSLTLHPLDPWRHNRHMTIVCSGSTPMRAVYFARRLRAPVITPVYLRDPKDAARVKSAFDLMRNAIVEKEVWDDVFLEGSDGAALEVPAGAGRP